MNNNWKVIPGFEKHEASIYGDIRKRSTKVMLKSHVIKTYKQIRLTICKGNRPTKKLHRLIAMTFIHNPLKHKIVDHIDGNKLNNNIDNLRWCSVAENTFNQKTHSNNKLNIKGIQRTINNTYQARITCQKQVVAKTHKSLLDAVKWRCNKEEELFGEFMPERQKIVKECAITLDNLISQLE